MLKALIVDDERLARAELGRVLAGFPELITVIGEAANKNEAVRFISTTENPRPDVIFLDINMPRGSGFDVLEDIDYNGENPIHIVFVTAYNKYAVRAFSVNALDYLLKPVDEKRLAMTLERLEKIQKNTGVVTHSTKLLEDLNSNEEPTSSIEEKAGAETGQKLTSNDFVFVTIGRTMRFVPVLDITFIRSNGNYSELYLHDGKQALILRTMNEWEAMLPPDDFLRIHRGTIINRTCIDNERPLETFGTSAQMYLRSIDEPFVVSRRYLQKLKERLV